MQDYKVTVVIPNYNHAAFLRQRIYSVLQQTYKPFEIIILDDCSTDNSRDIIREYVVAHPQIRFIENGINSGSPFAQWNKAVALATGDLIWIAESDDIAEPYLLEKIIHSFNTNNNVVLAYCQSNLINGKGEITGSCKTFTVGKDDYLFNDNFVMDGKEYIERFLIHRNTIPNASAVVFKKSMYELTGGLPLIVKNIGDWLAWLKILCYGNITFIAAPLNSFRRHEDSVIAKATSEDNKKAHKDWYGYNMRCEFSSFLKTNKIKLTRIAEKINANYLAIDKGNLGLYYLQSKRFVGGWKLILQASFYPTPQSGFIKRAIFKTNKKKLITE